MKKILIVTLLLLLFGCSDTEEYLEETNSEMPVKSYCDQKGCLYCTKNGYNIRCVGTGAYSGVDFIAEEDTTGVEDESNIQ